MKKWRLALMSVAAWLAVTASPRATIDWSQRVGELRDAKVYAQDGSQTFLGKIVNSSHTDSIFNRYGTYGSDTSNTSIWNKFSPFGGENGQYSPFNAFASPPKIIKDGMLVGYLTVRQMGNSISPEQLRALQDQF